MSRIGKLAIDVPPKVEVKVQGGEITVKGPKGTLTRAVPPDVDIQVESGKLQVNRQSESRRGRAMHGLARALLANMVTGVSSGFILNLDLRQPIQHLETSSIVTGPHLVSETGQVYSISGRSTLIGRPDPPRNPPDIDLTDLDYQQVTSRRHAQIWQDQSHRYWIKDLRSTNGVLVNGQPLSQGQRTRLQEGSRLQFGHGGPILIFHHGNNPA